MHRSAAGFVAPGTRALRVRKSGTGNQRDCSNGYHQAISHFSPPRVFGIARADNCRGLEMFRAARLVPGFCRRSHCSEPALIKVNTR
ncbi:hypothetical protein BRAS3843_1060011 [Bradyrhizobium sp. STM 3843]|nr:hypothetical protein BRAS3843_1060011 [Bradyrhizobium sp. STM 3843]